MSAEFAMLVETLRRLQVLSAEQMASLPSEGEPAALLRELTQRGWVTAFQANSLSRWQGSSLILGNYLLLDRLGEGGMGAVYKARHRKLHHLVALKVIKVERLGSVDAVRRFQREIHATAALSHPNIVHARDADAVDDLLFLVMEYVEGVDLRKHLAQAGPLSAAAAINYLRQVAQGLEYAREKSLVHRDIKPHNLLLSPTGVVKILDLGLARMPESADASSGASLLTGEGTVMGTIDYIAPEQAVDAHTADHRSDLYSLGCTFYHLLTGRVPFPQGTMLKKIDAHRYTLAESLEMHRPDLPASLVDVITRLMAKRPEERFQTAAELLAAIDPAPKVSSESQPDANPFAFDAPTLAQPSRPRRRWMVPVGVAALLGLVLVVWLLWPRSPRPIETAGETQEYRDYVALVGRTQPQPTESTAIEQLRQDLIGFATTHAAGKYAGRIRFELSRLPSPIDRVSPKDIPADEQPALPPEVIAVLGESRGRATRALNGVALRHDGKFVLGWGQDSHIRIWEAGSLRLIAKAPLNREVLSAVFSPQGNRVFVTAEKSQIRVFAFDDKTLKEETPVMVSGNTDNVVTALALQGTRLYAGDALGVVHCLDVSVWPPKHLSSERRHSGHIRRLYASPDGQTLVSLASEEPPVLGLWNITEKGAIWRNAEKQGDKVIAVAFSADGKRMAVGNVGDFVIIRDRTQDGYSPGESIRIRGIVNALCFGANDKEIWIGQNAAFSCVQQNEKGWQIVREQRGHMEKINGICTPDAGKTFYTASSDWTMRVWTRTSDRLTEPREFVGHSMQATGLAFSPDGRWLVTSGWGYGSTRLWDLTARPIRDEIVIHGSNRSGNAAYSPDGRYFLSTNLGLQMFTMPDRKRWLPDLKHDVAVVTLAFTPDGKCLLTDSEGKLRLWDVASGKVMREVKHGTYANRVAFAPHGRWVVAAMGGYPKDVADRVRILDTESLEELQRFDDHPGIVYSATVHPDERRVITGCSSGMITVHDRETGGLLMKMNAGVDLRGLAVVPGGRWLISMGTATLSAWDLDSGGRVRDISLPEVAIGFAMAPDGRHVAVGLDTGMVCIVRL